MFSKTSLDEFKQAAKDHQRIAISMEMAGDNITPVSVIHALGDEAKDCALLESSPDDYSYSRYSHIGLYPRARFNCSAKSDSLDELRQFYKDNHAHVLHELGGFSGGIVGFMAYDAVRSFENIPAQHENKDNVPDYFFTSYQTNITFDHQKNKVVLSVIVDVAADVQALYQQACDHLKELSEKIQATSAIKLLNAPKAMDAFADVEIDLSDEEHMLRVERAKEYVKAGDVFQVVLSRCFKRQYHCDEFSIYRALRMVSAAPYLFYLDAGDFILTGASPEKLVSLEAGLLKTIPIAGTRGRGKTEIDDDLLEAELLADEKELAEHLMLVDLSRNDLGRVAETGSVEVKVFNKVKRFSHVMHITSEVEAKIDESMDAFDALRVVLPAGTLSGAPKIRAMQIIDELENSRRGCYGGAVCFINANGDLNSCITIRSAVLKEGVATVRAGGGIVYDSDPRTEAIETKQKAHSVLAAIQLAEGEQA